MRCVGSRSSFSENLVFSHFLRLLCMQVWGILPRFYTHLAVPICRPPTQRSAACTQALSLLRLKRRIVISQV